MRGIDTEFLASNEEKVLTQILDEFGIAEIDAYVVFWGNDKIQIDGHLYLNEIQALTKTMDLIRPYDVGPYVPETFFRTGKVKPPELPEADK